MFSFAQVTGAIVNTGHSVLFKIDTNSSQAYDESRLAINITGGPLSYRYRFEEIHIHYGLHDQFGSEHSVQGYTFPAEVIDRISFCFHQIMMKLYLISCIRQIQIFGYNSQLYTNFTESLNRAQGIIGISVLLQVRNYNLGTGTVIRLYDDERFSAPIFSHNRKENCPMLS